MPAQRLIVKFGGTSVGSATAVCGRPPASRQPLRGDGYQVIVVTSAMSGVTDALLGGSRRRRVRRLSATRTSRPRGNARTEAPRDAQATSCATTTRRQVVSGSGRSAALGVRHASATRSPCSAKPRPRALDAVASLGERMSVHAAGRRAARAGRHGRAAVDAARRSCAPTRVPVGGAAHDRDAATCPGAARPAAAKPASCRWSPASSAPRRTACVTTLGRGGSDYSAAILGAAHRRRRGLDLHRRGRRDDRRSARGAGRAHPLEMLSYREMSELAYFGAKVLHPKTILPALERGIPLRIRNTFNPTHPGTLVVGQGRTTRRAASRASPPSNASASSRSRAAACSACPASPARAFGAVASTGTSVPMISQASSEQSICFVVPQMAATTVVEALRLRVRARAGAARHREHLDARRGGHRHRRGRRRSGRRRASRAASSARSGSSRPQRDRDRDGLVGVQHQPGGRGTRCRPGRQDPAHVDLIRTLGTWVVDSG